MKFVKNMMKAVGIAALGALLVVGVAGCGNSNNAASGNELPKKIVVGLDDNFPPMGFHDEAGNIVGFDIDLAKEAAKRLGMEVEFKPIDWDSKEAELNSKRIDVLWNGLTITPEREKNMLFSKPYLRGDQIIAVKDSSTIKDKADLAGKIVAVQSASSGLEALKKDPIAKEVKQIKEYGDFVTAFLDLEVGRVDAVVVDNVVGYYLMNKKPGTFREATGKVDSEVSGIGMRKGDTALKDAIDKTMGEMMQDGTADKIAQKWFGTTEPLMKESYTK